MVTDDLQNLSLEDSQPTSLPPQPSLSDPSSNKASAPFFFPPLWLARRTACISALRKEGIRSVVELGCGPGAVLSLLTQPAEHLDEFPSLYPPEPYSSSPSSPSVSSPSAIARSQKLQVLRSIPRRNPTENELHLRKVIGVDIRADSLQQAAKVVEPPAPTERREGESWSPRQQERWEGLSVQLYEGGLEVYNEALENVEAVIATEVLEHLTPNAFKKFPSTVLGLYGPRLCIVTTPNHEFNPYFVASGKEEETLHRFVDPTGRTNRVFRDEDHQFEMTREEFEEWATKAADDYDYTVSFSGVGSLAGYFNTSSRSSIPFPPPSLSAHPALINSPASLAVPDNPSTFYATQIATFRKIIPNEAERSPRSHRPTPLPFFSSPLSSPNIPLPGSPTSPTTALPSDPSAPTGRPSFFSRQSTSPTPHKLVHSVSHPAHPSASASAPLSIILRHLKTVLRDSGDGEGGITLRRAWGNDELRELCGGTIGNIVDAVLEEDEREMEWEFELVEGKEGYEALRIVWLAFEKGEGGLGSVTESREEEEEEEDEVEDPDYGDVDEALGDWEGEADDGWAPAESASAPSFIRPGGWR
ncbi:hypothetical protein BCR35DRAFT_284068 [Leucosporidium creatinivorum]|uniref:Small RNA 2'-O-methyltransferase n=1 Tax=Leucosporidium creatinivorum TaxID=106004 RepID=A0A1Y2DCD9_9BASI|nr:hypothetical protein BCR35DRAFT_284068 [Leucosporidium creatinivorum]